MSKQEIILIIFFNWYKSNRDLPKKECRHKRVNKKKNYKWEESSKYGLSRGLLKARKCNKNSRSKFLWVQKPRGASFELLFEIERYIEEFTDRGNKGFSATYFLTTDFHTFWRVMEWEKSVLQRKRFFGIQKSNL